MFDAKLKGRPPKEMPAPPYDIDKVLRLKAQRDMYELLYVSVIDIINDEHSDLYKVLDSYIDIKDYNLTDSVRKEIRETFKRNMADLIVLMNAKRKFFAEKRYRGGAKKKNI